MHHTVLLLTLVACAPPSDGQLLSTSVRAEVPGAVVHDVVYASDGLRVRGIVAVPDGPGPHPLVHFAHGGFEGMRVDEVVELGVRAAATSSVVAASMYRGEGGSEGEVEYCLGEVSDAWNLGLAVPALTDVVGPGVAIGSSHGACVALMLNARAAEAGDPLLGTVALGTPSDVDAVLAWHHARGDEGAASVWERWIEPGTDHRAQSPRFAALAPPIVLLHGLEDTLVPLEQACLLRDALAPPWPLRSHRILADGMPGPVGPVEDCQGWLDDGDPSALQQDGLRLISMEQTPHVPTKMAWETAWTEVSHHFTYLASTNHE